MVTPKSKWAGETAPDASHTSKTALKSQNFIASNAIKYSFYVQRWEELPGFYNSLHALTVNLSLMRRRKQKCLLKLQKMQVRFAHVSSQSLGLGSKHLYKFTK